MKRRQDEARLRTDSATGTLVAAHGEGSKVVGAVSSEMAIPYFAKTLQRKTMVPPERYVRATLFTATAADALERGWQDDSIVSLGK